MSGVCPRCARRAWLLEKLSRQLDYRTRDLSRFFETLALSDLDLIDALGGRRRGELRAKYADWESRPAESSGEVERICRHRRAYPASLRDSVAAPHALDVRGGVARLGEMLGKPAVAIVGARRASDYGFETARGLARGLAASGVTVLSGLADGIPAAVHGGALEARGLTLTVVAGGVERCSPASCDSLYRRILAGGCAVSEMRAGLRASPWSELARARTLALLAELVIVVEAEERPWELACAHLAQTLGRPVAAVPGRVSSRASRGTNRLLMCGAPLVRHAQDALDLLYESAARDMKTQSSTSSALQRNELEPKLRAVLEEVGMGHDTVAKLQGSDRGHFEVASLAELELRGLLVRGDGGRYVPCAEMSCWGGRAPRTIWPGP